MDKIKLPKDYNYIGIFLTLRCNYNCSYCINKYGAFDSADEMTAEAWTQALTRIPTRHDLPLSIQGGEPTIYPGFYDLAQAMAKEKKSMDLLTNGSFDLREFCELIAPKTFKRGARYASIRLSLHAKTDIQALAMKTYMLQNSGYEVGIWGFKIPWKVHDPRLEEAISLYRGLNIDFRIKEFLGKSYTGDKIHGTYKYPEAINSKPKKVWCKSSELLINPSGKVFRCHADLYAGRNPLGHILDKNFKIREGFYECTNYGRCNPCDIKLKTDRFQKNGHCSVEIKGA